MQLNLYPPSLVNAAGGLLFALVGIGVLTISRGARRAILVGGLSVSFGAAYVVQNLILDASVAVSWVQAAIYASAVVFALLLARDIAHGATPGARRSILALGLATGAVSLLVPAAALTDQNLLAGNGFRPDVHGVVAVMTINFVNVAVVILIAACATRSRALDANADGERRALVGLALAFGVYATFFVSFTATVPLPWTAFFGFAGMSVAAVVASSGFLGATRDGAAIGRRAFAGILLAAFAAFAVNLARDPLDSDLGSFGIARTIGVALLVVAIARYGLLGVELPHLAAKRGTLAAGALATLLIVAQVAQNWLSAQYGLLMGGIVAGALVFAASPLQRAMERVTDGRAPPPSSPPASAIRPPPSSADAYRHALRAAMRDGILTRREERHLAELARVLGIDAAHALDLREEVEREVSASGA